MKKIRIQLHIDEEVDLRFRKLFVNKKGDISIKITELMLKEINRIERRLK